MEVGIIVKFHVPLKRVLWKMNLSLKVVEKPWRPPDVHD